MNKRAVKIIKFTLSHEGGYANNPSDKGGETYRGISRRYHPEWVGWKTIDQIKQHRKIKNNEIIEALELPVMSFYYYKFWILHRVDEITDLADLVFDMLVNHSIKNATKIIQRSLNELGAKLTVDGILGSKTIESLNTYLNNARNHIVNNRIEYYKSLDDFDIFGEVWLARARLYYG